MCAYKATIKRRAAIQYQLRYVQPEHFVNVSPTSGPPLGSALTVPRFSVTPTEELSEARLESRPS